MKRGEFSVDTVVLEFDEALRRSRDMAAAVAAVNVLTNIIKKSNASTVMELEKELSTTADKLQRGNPSDISVRTACDLFLRYVGRAKDVPDFDTLKKTLIERGTQFAHTSIHARQVIAKFGSRFIGRGVTVLVHGFSRVVQCILEQSAHMKKEVNVVVTEGRPHNSGKDMADFLSDLKIPCTVVSDTGVAYIMRRVDMVLVGASGVTENGGILSRLGTYQVALCAKALNKPFYVATESYKFSRLYPLNQYDVPKQETPVDFGPLYPEGINVVNPTRDFTPPELISLLFTDLGILTPAAVSDELIQMYSDGDRHREKMG
ncbi:hypothetical protein BSKO_09580 [Bryopsis sp. KO-2023]|nr:hypothetical protein BSKO_09580 [Bryopsis sp. KO-2023]